MTIIEYLTVKLDELLDGCRDDDQRITVLARAYGTWTQKRARFYAQAQGDYVIDPEFKMGPYGWLTATDFHLILNMIDRKRLAIARRSA